MKNLKSSHKEQRNNTEIIRGQNKDTMKSSIEWLWEQIPYEFTSKRSAFEVFEQAKEMEAEQRKITENTSDGYHTFKELYEFRKVYNAALFNEWGKQKYYSRPNIAKYDVHKSWKHNDGELCFGGGWFIVVAILPTGQISNHYEAKDWELFNIPEVEKAKYEFDGHTPADVISCLNTLK